MTRLNDLALACFPSSYFFSFSDEPNSLGQWDLIRNWLNESNGEQLIKDYCQEAHKRFGLGENKTIETFSFNQRTLKFRTTKYKPMLADVLTYGIDLEGKDPKKNRKYWHIMEGQRPDCVWYLEPVNEEETEFELREHVYYVKYYYTN